MVRGLGSAGGGIFTESIKVADSRATFYSARGLEGAVGDRPVFHQLRRFVRFLLLIHKTFTSFPAIEFDL